LKLLETDKNLQISTNSILSSVGEDQDELLNTLKIKKTEVQTLEDSFDQRVKDQVSTIQSSYDAKAQILEAKLSVEREKSGKILDRANETFLAILKGIQGTDERALRDFAKDEFEVFLAPSLALEQTIANMSQNSLMQASVLEATVQSQKDEINRLRSQLEEKRKELSDLLVQTSKVGTNPMAAENLAKHLESDKGMKKSTDSLPTLADSAYTKTTGGKIFGGGRGGIGAASATTANPSLSSTTSLIIDLQGQLDAEKKNYHDLEKSYEDFTKLFTRFREWSSKSRFPMPLVITSMSFSWKRSRISKRHCMRQNTVAWSHEKVNRKP
jgi:hypothetical protein